METDTKETDRVNTAGIVTTTPPLLIADDLLEYISRDPDVFFKNQQKNDPVLSNGEKKNILREVLNKSHWTFLFRFGLHIKDEHLHYFEQDEQTQAYCPDERYAVDFHLKRIRKLRNGGRAIQVLRRRYAALQKMCDNNMYFTEQEMMHRDPLLYEQLVGQYMTKREKRERDVNCPLTPSVSSIILDKMHSDQARETLKKLETEELQQGQDEEEMNESEDRLRSNSPDFPRGQWGNFEDEEKTRIEERLHERRMKARRRMLATPPHLVTAGEKNMLRDEFIRIMYDRFMEGKDEEFDYSHVDNSLEYDDLTVLEQDKHDKYFDEEDETKTKQSSVHTVGEESEDDLDIYMKHVNLHLQLQERVSREVEAQVCEYDSDE